jgi:hypothetical protein
MKEEFLQYVWKFQQFKSNELVTTEGLPVEVVYPGEHNVNAGPDFLNARIRIGGTLWAGNVEVHVRASDWYRHNHHHDPSYKNVILHVVYTPDKEVHGNYSKAIPVLRLDDKIDFQSYRYYKAWLKKSGFIPCEGSVSSVPEMVKQDALESMAVERIQEKSQYLLDALRLSKGDLEQVFYASLCRSLGLKVNAMPFEQLSNKAPFKLVRKYRDQPIKLEALLLGQAGFLSDKCLEDPYIATIKEEYSFIQSKHALEPMGISSWKLSRLRPASFPPLRIAQLSQIYSNHPGLAAKIMETETYEELATIFSVEPRHVFWRNHFSLNTVSAIASSKSLGANTVRTIVINTVIPFLFATSSFNRDGFFREKALNLLESMKPENNKITRSYSSLGFPTSSAIHSQGMIGLKKRFCEQSQCLNCKIGVFILKKSCSD